MTTKIKTLWVIDDITPGLLENRFLLPILKFCFSMKLRALEKRIQPGDYLLGPVLLGDIANTSKYEFIEWPQLRLFATCAKESLEEFIEFNRIAVQILEQEKATTVKGYSIPKSLSYAFMSPLAEDLPYFISGAKNLIEKKNIQNITVIGPQGFFAQIASDLGEIHRLPTRRERFFLSYLLIKIQSLLKSFQLNSIRQDTGNFVQGNSEQKLPAKNGILFPVGKNRVFAYAEPTINVISSLTKKPLITLNPFTHPRLPAAANCADFYQASELEAEFSSLKKNFLEIWDRSRAKIRQIPTTYLGVKIAKLHLETMESIWTEKAAIAALGANHIDEILEKISPEIIVLNDQLEFPYLLSKAAQKKNIPIIFNQQMADGYVASANIIEHHIHDMANYYASFNSWMRNRWIQRGFTNEKKSMAIGSVLHSKIYDREAKQKSRKKICAELGLNPDKPIVVFFSRSISFTLTWPDKKWILEECLRAVDKLDAQFIVKAHPYEDLSILKRQVAQFTDTAKVLAMEIPLLDLAAGADMCVGTPGSTANLEVNFTLTPLAIGGSELAFEAFNTENDRFAYRRLKSGVCVSTHQDLSSIICRFVEDDKFADEWIQNGKAFAERIVGVLDGKANERLAQWTLEILKERGQQ